MSLTLIESSDRLLNKILKTSLGDVLNVLEDKVGCRVYLNVIEQNTPIPGTEFERKITVSAGGLPLIRAVIKFDRKILPESIVKQLLQKTEKISTILGNHGIPIKKNTIFLTRTDKKLFRIYEIKNSKKVWFEVSEEIKLDNMNVILREFPA